LRPIGFVRLRKCPEREEVDTSVNRLILASTPRQARSAGSSLQGTTRLRHSRSETPTATVPPNAYDVLRSSGQPLDPHARTFFESRFGHDFSQVRVHTDAAAAESARRMNALAYTVGRDVVFGRGQYAPGTRSGRVLLGHELTHVLQQSARPQHEAPLRFFDSVPHEREANLMSRKLAAGQETTAPASSAPYGVARFSDTGHHVIEEAGLGGAGFSEQQIKAVERGNIQRDYSQIGAVGNLALLCKPESFGGYKPEEHFDNFIFDAVTNRWRTRGMGKPFLHDDPKTPDRSPTDYITSELMTLANQGMNEESLVHLGNAFHTVEDFFAHSNFVELINQDFSFGKDLLTGSFEGESVNTAASLAHTLGGISSPPMGEYYAQQAESAAARTEPRSHSRMAKDTPGARNYEQARRLAALVIQDLGTDVLAAMKPAEAGLRTKLITDSVIAKLQRYLRPPSPTDRWWDQLTTADKGAIDQRLTEAAGRTPVTVNQCVFSPLRNVEASSTSTWKLPIGVAMPIQIGSDHIWLQAGFGATSPLPLDRSLREPARVEDRSQLIGGAQITGRF
jgi:hypothetical protein